MTLVHLQRLQMKMNKPIYVGNSILELSKILMYKLHFEYLEKFPGIKLCFTDTGSFLYRIPTNDFYEDVRNDVETKYNTSAFPIGHQVKLPRVNKKVIGLMKDETCGNEIVEFCGPRAKLYSYKVEKCLAQKTI